MDAQYKKVWLDNGEEATLLYDVSPAGYVVQVEAVDNDLFVPMTVHRLVSMVYDENPLGTRTNLAQEQLNKLGKEREDILADIAKAEEKLNFYMYAIKRYGDLETLGRLEQEIREKEHELRLMPIKIRVAKEKLEKEMSNAK